MPTIYLIKDSFNHHLANIYIYKYIYKTIKHVTEDV